MNKYAKNNRPGFIFKAWFGLGLASFATFVAGRMYLDSNRRSLDLRKKNMKRRQLEMEKMERERSSSSNSSELPPPPSSSSSSSLN
ncbi:hypothetical protein AYI69_g2962 [Smittium culicis]|uniref:Uncharacterized protein n=1 Tax=Smittium culicis TaxID=133412 RepID=A0A1R1YL38_9FUNG|nr:hypothetical protein AYI69_g2962 [Smittium culicis]